MIGVTPGLWPGVYDRSMLRGSLTVLLAGLIGVSAAATSRAAEASPEPPGDQSNVIVEAPEPQWVVPTRRDRIGRIWAPVMIDGKGPFRLAFDTGATRSAITTATAAALGLTPDTSRPVKLRGVTGTSIVPTVRAESFQVGDLLLKPLKLPVLVDAFGGADGILGTEGFGDRRVRIEFRHDRIVISRSHGERAGAGYLTIPFDSSHNLPIVDARMGGVAVKALIDTGAQMTIGNLALRDALRKRRDTETPTTDVIVGITLDEQTGEGRKAPPIVLGGLLIRSPRITFADMLIFEHWRLTGKPAVLIGMDALGLLDTLIIDYRRRELQLAVPG